MFGLFCLLLISIMKKNSQPKYYARPSDGTIFSLNDDHKTYSIEESKKSHPHNFHYKYSQEHLLNVGFYKVTKKDFSKLRMIGDEYYAYLSWSTRSDGHGGIKGGTIKEFRNLNKQKHARNH